MDKEALLWKKLEGKKVHCYLCAHECRIAESKFGICGVRKNIDGILHSLVYADVVAAHIDPIEKKPLYHFLPGSRSYSIATRGCNFRCGFCQNWQISQATGNVDGSDTGCTMLPEQVVEQARNSGCLSISYTYTEPTIFFEFALDTSKLAKQAGLYNVFVSNGYMTAEALKTIAPYLDAANIDLKSFSDAYYKKNCGARLNPVLDTISSMNKQGIWLEVTTLVIPGENDSDEELGKIAGFLAQVDKDIPWHVSRFHPDYQFIDHKFTPLETLKKAKDIGREKGLRYIYLGNVPEEANTYCYHCGEVMVERIFMGAGNSYLKKGHCGICGTEIRGVWSNIN
jgi:pyruvate formate lyase activating enzyme